MSLPNMRRLYATLIVSVFVFSLTMLGGVLVTRAQTTGSGSLRGTVQDPAGAIIRDASVTLINERTKDERHAKTNDEGAYVFNAVTPGT